MGCSSFLKISAVGLLLGTIHTGCAFAPRLSEIENADYGPKPVDVEVAVKKYFSDILFDPFSAHYEIGKPFKAWRKTTLRQAEYGWRVDVRLNAKNQMGGYVGWETYYFLFHGENIIHAEAVVPIPNMWESHGTGPN